jgi:hypothetical protein
MDGTWLGEGRDLRRRGNRRREEVAVFQRFQKTHATRSDSHLGPLSTLIYAFVLTHRTYPRIPIRPVARIKRLLGSGTLEESNRTSDMPPAMMGGSVPLSIAEKY